MRLALVVLALATARGGAQVAPADSLQPPAYRGFAPGMSYRSFAIRAQSLAPRDTLRCDTSRRTAQLMECRVAIVDPGDRGHFDLSAYVIEGRVAWVSLGDSGTAAVVTRMQGELTRRFGRPRPIGAGAWEWRYGRRVARLTWRARGPMRWVYVNLTDDAMMDRIQAYVAARK